MAEKLAKSEEQLAAWRAAAPSPAGAGVGLEQAIVYERRRTSHLTAGLAAARAAIDHVLDYDIAYLSAQNKQPASTSTTTKQASSSASALLDTAGPTSPSSSALAAHSPIIASHRGASLLDIHPSSPAKRRRTDDSFRYDALSAISSVDLGPLTSATPSASSTISSASSLSMPTPPSHCEGLLSDDFTRRLLGHRSADHMDQHGRRARAASASSSHQQHSLAHDQGHSESISSLPTSWDVNSLATFFANPGTASKPQAAEPPSAPPITADLHTLLTALLARLQPATSPLPSAPTAAPDQAWSQALAFALSSSPAQRFNNQGQSQNQHQAATYL